MTQPNRPLSPHLQVYRLPLLAYLSITHRITGIALSAGALLLAYWLGSAAYGPAAYDQASAFLGSPIGLLILFGFSIAFYFHLCSSIRHLFWDAGRGYELSAANAAGRLVLVATAILTIITWAVGRAL